MLFVYKQQIAYQRAWCVQCGAVGEHTHPHTHTHTHTHRTQYGDTLTVSTT
jgi:hypothetical protein